MSIKTVHSLLNVSYPAAILFIALVTGSTTGLSSGAISKPNFYRYMRGSDSPWGGLISTQPACLILSGASVNKTSCPADDFATEDHNPSARLQENHRTFKTDPLKIKNGKENTV